MGILIIWFIGILIFGMAYGLLCYFKPDFIKNNDLNGSISLIIILCIICWPAGIFVAMMAGLYCFYEYLLEKGENR